MLPLIPVDKANHAIYGALIGACAALACTLTGNREAAPFASTIAAAIIGVLKEGVDKLLNVRAARAGLAPPHGVEVMDAVATFSGGLFLGIILAL